MISAQQGGNPGTATIKGLKNLGNTCFLNSLTQVFRRLNPESHRLLRQANPKLAKHIFDEKNVNNFFRFLFGHNPGNADSVTTTYSEITEVLNGRKETGPSDGLFGLYDG